MPSIPSSAHPTDSLTFRYRSGGHSTRRFPYPVEARQLADTLVEFSTGGAWCVKDVDADLTFNTRAAQLFVVPAERRHSLAMLRGRPMQTRWGLVALEDELGRDALARLPHSFALPLKASVRAARLLMSIERLPNTGTAERVAFQRLGMELAALLIRHSPVPLAPLPKPAEQRMEEVLRFVRDHLHRPLSREELARRAHLSPTRFHYVFLEATGEAPMKYLMAQRLRRARQLLLSTTLSSKEIGQQCGFVNSTHFSRIFTRQLNISPLAYRATMGKT